MAVHGISEGGSWNTWMLGLIAVSTIQRSGNRNSASTNTSNARDIQDPRRNSNATECLRLIEHPFPLQQELYGRDYHDDHEQRPGDSRGVAHMVVLETVLI